MSKTDRKADSATLAWSGALATAAILGTLATACMMPFVALAVATAATMPKSRAAATLGLVWATNQLLGFTLLGYPMTPFALAWGAALGVASIAAMLVAAAVIARSRLFVVGPISAFLAAFVAYEGGLFAFALVAGGTSTFTMPIMLQILVNDTCWLAALALLHSVLTWAAPRTFGPALSLRAA